MKQPNSVTALFYELQDGQEEALQRLWERYSDRLIRVASQGLANSPKRLGDEFDIANSVFHGLYRGAASGRLRSVQNRDQLWWLLLAMTKKKTVDHQRRERAQKRGDARTFSAEGNENAAGSTAAYSIEDLISQEPDAESVVMLQETLETLLSALRDDLLADITRRRLEGYSIPEIAELHSVASRTIERKLVLIRKKWSNELNTDV